MQIKRIFRLVNAGVEYVLCMYIYTYKFSLTHSVEGYVPCIY